MNKKSTIIVAVIGVALLLLLVRSCGTSYFLKRYNWNETYADKKNHVYGTYVIKRFLEYTSTRGRTDIDLKLSKYFNEESDYDGNYMFVGDAMLLDQSDAEALASFVGRGNKAIIATKVMPYTLSKEIFEPCRENYEADREYEGFERLYSEDDDAFTAEVEEAVEEEIDEVVEEITKKDSTNAVVYSGRYEEDDIWKYVDFDYLEFVSVYEKELDMQLDSSFRQTDETLPIFKTFKNTNARNRSWYYLHDSISCIANNEIEVLGYLDDEKVNFFELPYKEGSFFIHTNPLVFTNEHMLYDQNIEYITGVLSTCSQENWYWDEYSRTDISRGKRRNGKQNYLSSKGPLSYILNQAPLAWAWYCLLAMGLLFLLFRAKRKQRVIPVLVENENTSLAFINTIGNLYFRKNDHRQLCKEQLQLWLEKIRMQFRVNTSQLDTVFVAKLSVKSKVPKEEIQAILDFYDNIDNSNFVSENTMIKFYQKINQFEIQANQKI